MALKGKFEMCFMGIGTREKSKINIEGKEGD